MKVPGPVRKGPGQPGGAAIRLPALSRLIHKVALAPGKQPGSLVLRVGRLHSKDQPLVRGWAMGHVKPANL